MSAEIQTTSGGERHGTERAYVGRFATRAAFGEQLLRDEWSADERLARLPGWLRRYVQLDGALAADDCETTGVYEFAPADDDELAVVVYERKQLGVHSAQG